MHKKLISSLLIVSLVLVGAVLLTADSSVSSAQNGGWEYHILAINLSQALQGLNVDLYFFPHSDLKLSWQDFKGTEFHDDLNSLGADGWELSHILPVADSTVFIFKRWSR